MSFEFAALPPEISSGLMYSGSGSGPLMAAGAAYNNLAAELSTAATSWESIMSTLTTESWTGVGSAAAAAATAPQIAWLGQTAAALEDAGAQAFASAAAYEAAFGAIVPPAAIAANRAQLAALVATNFLGINTPAIAATEALYGEMWVQDAVTMYTYSAASTAAAALQPLTPATPTSNSGTAAAAVADATVTPFGQDFFQSLPQNVQNLLNSVDGFIGTLFNFNFVQQIGVTAAWFTGNTIPTAVSYVHTVAIASAAAPAAATSDVVPVAGGALPAGSSLVGSVGSMGSGGSLGAGAMGGMGQASTVGKLSVPGTWAGATPAAEAELVSATNSASNPSGWTAGVEEAAAPGTVVPGMPGMAGAAKSGALAGPRYGFKPLVMPKQVVV
jgi:PPE-repeat protein